MPSYHAIYLELACGASLYNVACDMARLAAHTRTKVCCRFHGQIDLFCYPEMTATQVIELYETRMNRRKVKSND